MKTPILIKVKNWKQNFSGKDYADLRYSFNEQNEFPETTDDCHTYQYQSITSDNTAIVRCHDDAHKEILNRYNEIDDLLDYNEDNLFWDHDKGRIVALFQTEFMDYYIKLDSYIEMEDKVLDLLIDTIG